MQARAHRVLDHVRRQWMGALSLFLALTGGVAYAANTIASSDIIDGEVKAADLAANAVNSSKIADGQVAAADIGQGAVATDELANGQVRNADIGAGEVRSASVANDNLTGGDIAPNAVGGADIDEGSLAGGLIPGIATSGLVKSSGVVRTELTVPESSNIKTLLTLGPYELQGWCNNFGGDLGAQVLLHTTVGPLSLDSDADTGGDFVDVPGGGFLSLAAMLDVPAASASFDSGDYTAVLPGRMIAGEAAAGTNVMGSDCVFAVTGIG